MRLADFFLFSLPSLAFILLIFQKVFIRVRRTTALEIEIEYFPFVLILSGFGKNPKNKFKLKKLSKYFSLAFSFFKSARFLLSHSEVAITDTSEKSQFSSVSRFDIVITSRLYVIVFAALVFIFSLIKRKGWNKRFV